MRGTCSCILLVSLQRWGAGLLLTSLPVNAPWRGHATNRDEFFIGSDRDSNLAVGGEIDLDGGEHRPSPERPPAWT